jgi:hypothetical protein
MTMERDEKNVGGLAALLLDTPQFNSELMASILKPDLHVTVEKSVPRYV